MGSVLPLLCYITFQVGAHRCRCLGRLPELGARRRSCLQGEFRGVHPLTPRGYALLAKRTYASVLSNDMKVGGAVNELCACTVAGC